MYISIQTLYSVLCWSTFGSDYSLESSCVLCYNLVHLYLGSFSHSSLQIISISIRLDGDLCGTAIFRSLQRCSIGYKSRPWLGHSRTFRDLSRSHSCIVLAVFLGLLSCWKVNLHPSLRTCSRALRNSLKISLYFAPFIFPWIRTGLPVPALQKHPHSMMLPPPWLSIGMVPGYLQTWR